MQDHDSESSEAAGDPVLANPDQSIGDTLVAVPVVGVGWEADELEAVRAMLAALPSKAGACYILAMQPDSLRPDCGTDLAGALAGTATALPVEAAVDDMEPVANRVLIVPADRQIAIKAGRIRLAGKTGARVSAPSIDAFFHSLATDQGDRAVAILFSGNGSDGTKGLRAVKGAGGLTLLHAAKDDAQAGRSRNAEAVGIADQVLPAREVATYLGAYLARLRAESEKDGLDARHRALREELSRICNHLKVTTGHDFRDYKEPTLIRRVQKRMQVLRVTEIESYVQRLRDDKEEVWALFRNLLVSVTDFFRDASAFQELDRQVLTTLLETKPDNEAIRVWVPGCATGEEAYSIAMILRDRIEQMGKPLRVQIFATDIDEVALAVARRGIYSEESLSKLPDTYAERFFRIVGNGHQVIEEVREFCIFSSQSLVKDPPFSRMDLISCRNVLIYLKTELQNRLIPVFHYALNPGGYLFLGTSENVTRHGSIFDTVDKKHRLFQRREVASRPNPQFALMDIVSRTQDRRTLPKLPVPTPTKRDAIVAKAERAILDELGPGFAVVNENRELVYSGGRIDPYLTFQKGAPTLEIVSIAHAGLRMDLRALLRRAMADQTEVTRSEIGLELADGRHRITLVCRPLDGGAVGSARNYLIVFREDGMAPAEAAATRAAGSESDAVQALEGELRSTKEYLDTTTAELESLNDELKSANEELMSMNEELQSSNEEFETSKEELQSVNEELETVNTELHSKVEELARSNADLQNLLESTQIATLFLDRDLRVRRFTPEAKDLFHLIDSDLGRSIADITSRVEGVDLAAEVRVVLERLAPVEREVKLRDSGNAYIMRLLPYRTPEEVIDGVVTMFVDVSGLKAAQREIATLNAQLQLNIEDLRTLLDLAPVGIAFADDAECETIEVNRYGAAIMKTTRQAAPAGNPNARYHFVRNGARVPAEDLPLQKAWRTGKAVRDFRATFFHEDGQSFEFLMSAAPVLDDRGKVRRVIGIYDDISRLVDAQAAAENRAVQHDFVSTIGSLSLRGQGAEQLIRTLPEQLARLLNVDFVKILRYWPETGDFSLEESLGFAAPKGTIVPGDLNSQAGYALTAAGPVIVQDMTEERRFSGPTLLREAGVVSGMSVLIGDPDNPWGVMGVHTRVLRRFTPDDVKFLQSVANIIAATLQRDAWGRQQRLLLDELRHRVKNSLATVQAIASLSFKGREAAPVAVQGYMQRLQALSLAHDLHFKSDWNEVELGEVVRRQIEPYDVSGDRIGVRGRPGVRLSPVVAIDMAMAVHELVTNAAKYGALSTEGGRVWVKWALESRGDDQCIVFEWKESDGPTVATPLTEGVGTKLLEALSKRSRFHLERRFESDGLYCRIDVLQG